MEEVFYPTEDFTVGKYKGIPVLHYDGYRKYRNDYFNDIFESFGLKKYYLRHGDEGDWSIPVTIENKFVWVNYCGCIFTFEDLSKYMVDGFIILEDDEAYDIIDADDIVEFMEFIVRFRKDS